jgi:hypothetical protein
MVVSSPASSMQQGNNRRIWNKIPDKIETAIVNLALEEPDLSLRELAVNFTDTKGSLCQKPLFIGS